MHAKWIKNEWKHWANGGGSGNVALIVVVVYLYFRCSHIRSIAWPRPQIVIWYISVQRNQRCCHVKNSTKLNNKLINQQTDQIHNIHYSVYTRRISAVLMTLFARQPASHIYYSLNIQQLQKHREKPITFELETANFWFDIQNDASFSARCNLALKDGVVNITWIKGVCCDLYLLLF